MVPALPARAAVFPVGNVNPPVPGNIGFDTMDNVTLPVEADAAIWFAVPVMDDTVPPTVASVPEVGNVTDVIPVIVKVLANAPDVVSDPPNVRVLEPLLTPVPPLAGDN